MELKQRVTALDEEIAPGLAIVIATGEEVVTGPGAEIGSTEIGGAAETVTGKETVKGRGTEKGTMQRHTPEKGLQNDPEAETGNGNENIENAAVKTVLLVNRSVPVLSLQKSLMLDLLSAPNQDIMMNVIEREIVNVSEKEREIPLQGESLNVRESGIEKDGRKESLLTEALPAINATFQINLSYFVALKLSCFLFVPSSHFFFCAHQNLFNFKFSWHSVLTRLQHSTLVATLR